MTGVQTCALPISVVNSGYFAASKVLHPQNTTNVADSDAELTRNAILLPYLFQVLFGFQGGHAAGSSGGDGLAVAAVSNVS